MRERRPRSLLDFAVAASVAVVPLMLGMLLAVAVVRPLDRPATVGPEQGDRYVSVRQVAALKTVEEAVVRRAGTDPARPTAADVLAALPQCRRDWAAKWSLAAWLRGLASDTPVREPSGADRVAARLAELDGVLHRFSTRPNPRVEAPVALDAQRWFAAAARALDTPFDVPEYPGRRFRVGCADLVGALASLARADGRLLEALAWRGTEGAATLAHWRPDQMMAVSAREVARRNPWNGVAGCIYLGGHGAGPTHLVAGGGSAQQRLCALPAMAGASAAADGKVDLAVLPGEPTPDLPPGDTRWKVPPSLQAMLQPLDGLRRPSSALYRLYTDLGSRTAEVPTAYRFGPNRIAMDGAPVDVGFSIDLTIDPSVQALAQQTAACYTGRQDVCRALGIRRAEDAGQPIGHRLLERAMVRMAAVAVIDVASGRIEALAGALSPCARQEVDGPGRGANCDRRLPYKVQYRPDALLNPAVFHDAMPASTIKPIMAAAFLADREVGSRWLAAERSPVKPGAAPARDSLRGQLMRSDSARFLDRMFCSDKGFADCKRPWDIQATAAAFGWNGGCDEARIDCGRLDLLFGRAVDATAESGAVRPLALPVAFGRLMSEPAEARIGAPQHHMPAMALPRDIVRRCALGVNGRRGGDDDWEKCRGGSVVDVVAEGWGQGHARSSALGVAGMMATLAAAANGQAHIRRPHLVQALRGVGEGDAATLQSAVVRWSLADAQPNRVPGDIARVILDGLSYSHRAGTARSACEQVFDPKTCRGFDWLAGKTGTPSFPSDGLSLDAIARMCAPGSPEAKKHAACGSLRPYKWYVAAYRTESGEGPWTKVIAVLTERNWVARSGIVHGASDHGPNPAAEIAMQVMGRQRGLITGAAP